MEINSIIIWVHTRHKGTNTRATADSLTHSRAKWNFEWLLILMRALASAARIGDSPSVYACVWSDLCYFQCVCTLLSIQIITARCQSIWSYGFTFGRVWQFVVVEEVVTK